MVQHQVEVNRKMKNTGNHSALRDEQFMKEALREAQKAFQKGEIPVGAVLVSENQIISRGHNQVELLHDATAHAEIIAITAACEHFSSKYLSGCTLYVTVEPCPMCAGAVAWSQVSGLVYGAKDPKKGYSVFSLKIIGSKIPVKGGVLGDECGRIMKDFFRLRREKS